MKKLNIFISFTVCLIFFLFLPIKANAGTLRPEMCDAVQLEPIINKTHTLPPITNKPSTNPTIYVADLDNSTLYFMEDGNYVKAETGEGFGNVNANLVLDKSIIAKPFPAQKIPAEFRVDLTTSSGCGEAWHYSIDSFPADGRIKNAIFGNNIIAHPDHWYCEEGFLKSFDRSAYQVKLVLGSEELSCPNLVFQKGSKPTAPCDITVNKPEGYTINDDVVITGINNIDAQCMNGSLDYNSDYYPVVSCSTDMYVGGIKISCGRAGDPGHPAGVGWAVLTRDGSTHGKDCSVHNLLPYDLGQLAAGTYTIQASRIRQWIALDREHDKVYCSKTISVVLPGETLTPEATNSANVGPIRIDVNLAAATALCESIPDSAMCGARGCKIKCEECSKPPVLGIWTGLGCLPTNVSLLVSRIFEIFSGVLGGFIFLCILWNGLKVMLSRGSPDALKKAQEAITSCIIGLLVLMFSVLFLKVAGVDILKIPGFGAPTAQEQVKHK